MLKISNNPSHRNAIHHLIQEDYYVGSVSSKGFIIKRNFGIRRLTLYGIFESEEIIIKAKNEFLHQVFLIFGFILFIFLMGLTIYMQEYWVSLLLLILIILMGLDNQNRIRNEYKLLEETLAKLQ